MLPFGWTVGGTVFEMWLGLRDSWHPNAYGQSDPLRVRESLGRYLARETNHPGESVLLRANSATVGTSLDTARGWCASRAARTEIPEMAIDAAPWSLLRAFA